MDYVFDMETQTKMTTVCARANPDALSSLRKVVSNKELLEYHANAWRMIGYVGDAKDVSLLEAFFKSHAPTIEGAADDWSLDGALDGLAILYKRDVRGARQLLSTLLDPDYWNQWKPGNARAGDTPLKYIMSARAAEAYALSEKAEFDDIIKKTVDSIADPKVKENMAFRVGPERLRHRQLTGIVRVNEDEALRRIAGKFDGDLEKPDLARTDPSSVRPGDSTNVRSGTNSIPLAPATGNDRAEAAALAKDAMAAFANIKTHVVDGDFASLKSLVLFQDKPIIPQLATSPDVWGMAMEKFKWQQLILASDAAKNALISALRIEHQKIYQLDFQNMERASAGEVITVSWKLVGTLNQAKDQIRSGTPTRADDGNLIVVMKKIDGQWYWVPFGW